MRTTNDGYFGKESLARSGRSFDTASAAHKRP
jgi:hypothetical protein